MDGKVNGEMDGKVNGEIDGKVMGEIDDEIGESTDDEDAMAGMRAEDEAGSKTGSASVTVDSGEILYEEAERVLENGGFDTKTAVLKLEQAAELGHSGAMATLANLYFSGDGFTVGRNVKKALHYAQRGAELGNPDAQSTLAFAYAMGIPGTLEKSEHHAILYWTLALNGGNALAHSTIGYRFLNGIGLEESCLASVLIYERSAAHALGLDRESESDRDRVADALERRRLDRRIRLKEEHLSLFTRDFSRERASIASRTAAYRRRTSIQQPSASISAPQSSSTSANSVEHDVVGYYQHAADNGDLNAVLALALTHFFGLNGVRPDLQRARDLFEIAANEGVAAAYTSLGYMHLKGLGGVDSNNQSALSYFQAAADQGDPAGINGLGYCYLHGIGVEQNDKRAFQLFERAAKLGHDEAIFNLGVLHLEGIGTVQNEQAALTSFLSAAHKGHSYATYHAGVMLSPHPQHVFAPYSSSMTSKHAVKESMIRSDCTRAVRMLKHVSDLGDPTELVAAAETALVSGDHEIALYRYLQAAHAGIELAQYNAAMLLEHIEGSDAKRQAAALYEESAAQGYRPSLARAGNLLWNLGLVETAYDVYSRGAKLSDPESLFQLGTMYLQGIGAPRDSALAKRYFDSALRAHSDANVPVMIALFVLKTVDFIKNRLEIDLVQVFRRFAFSKRSEFRDMNSGEFSYQDAVSIGWDIPLIAGLIALLALVLAIRRYRLQNAIIAHHEHIPHVDPMHHEHIE